MAEQILDVADLPVATQAEFQNSPNYIVVINGSARLSTWNQLTTWIANNVQGEKGEQGADGQDGVNGANGVSPTHSWDGTELTITSASGTSSADLKGEKGDQGDVGETGDNGIDGLDGIDGSNGWTPVYALESYLGNEVLKIVDWVGGDEPKPEVNVYISDTGFTEDIAEAVNLKGSSGEGAKEIETLVFDTNNNLVLTFDDTTSITATQNKKTGVGLYIDGASVTTPIAIPQNATTLIPNDATTEDVSLLPSPYVLYDPELDLILVPEKGYYEVVYEFLCTSTVEGVATISLDRSASMSQVECQSSFYLGVHTDLPVRVTVGLIPSTSVTVGLYSKILSTQAITLKNLKMYIKKIT